MLSPDSALRIDHGNGTPDRLDSNRKFSFPIGLHSSTLLGDVSARRRFSNVGDAFSRKLSNTIGWKIPCAIPVQDIITQGKCLCGQYIRFRLKRSGIFNKKLGLQRIRSIIGTPSIHVVRDVFPALNFVSQLNSHRAKAMCVNYVDRAIFQVGEELERMHPSLFSSVARQLSRSTGGELQDADSAPVLLMAVARDLFRIDITWSKVFEEKKNQIQIISAPGITAFQSKFFFLR